MVKLVLDLKKKLNIFVDTVSSKDILSHLHFGSNFYMCILQYCENSKRIIN